MATTKLNNKNIQENNQEESTEKPMDKEFEAQKAEADSNKILYLDPYHLKPHPRNVEIYGSDDPDDIAMLTASILDMGQLEPVVIGNKHKILSGHRRWKAICEIKKNAKTEEEAEKVKVMCIYRKFDTLAEKEALIEYNRQRKKNYEQIYHEVKLLEEIYAEQAERRMKFGKPLDPESDLSQGMGEPGRTIEKQAAVTGINTTQLKKLIKIGDRCIKNEKKKNQKFYENAINVMKELRTGELSLDAADKKLEILDRQYDETIPEWKRSKIEDLARDVNRHKISPNKASDKLKKIINEEKPPEQETKTELPEGVFDVIVADPQSIDKARELKIYVDDAACFLWANVKNMKERIELLEHWGFGLKEIAVCNTKKQGGIWFYGGAEFLLFGIKGDMTHPKLGAAEGEGEIANLFFDRDLTRDPAVTYTRAVHKSIVVYEMAEKMFPGRTYCDPFRRNERAGWLQPNIVEEEIEAEEEAEEE